MNHYDHPTMKSGDLVLITGKKELETILDQFCPSYDCIAPLTITEIADRYATIIDFMKYADSTLDLGEFAVLIFDDGQDILLPTCAFQQVQMTIEENLEESLDWQMVKDKYLQRQFEELKESNQQPENDKTSKTSNNNESVNVVQNLAAEMIQNSFR